MTVATKVKVFVIKAGKEEIGVAPTSMSADQILKTYVGKNPGADVSIETDERYPDPAWASEATAE